MKQILLPFFVLLTLNAFATTWTVDNNPGAGAQFSALQAAHDAASAGDTLLVKGSSATYGALVVTKEIHVIGEGLKPNKNQFSNRTELSSISIQRDNTNDPSNTSVSGVYFTSGSTSPSATIAGSTSAVVLSGVKFERCYFTWETRVNSHTPGLIFNQCFFNNGFRFSNANAAGSTWTIQNSFIAGFSAYIGGIGGGNRLVKNCVFYGPGNGNAISGISTTFDNNIFYGLQAISGGLNIRSCVFRNNLSFGNLDNSFSPGPITSPNTLSSNISGQDPLFVSASVAGPPFNFLNDYNLQSTSPGKNYGTDGTDIGVYGGAGFVEGGISGGGFQTAPMPAIPQMLELNIQNPVVPENGTLNVKVVGRNQQ